MDRSWVSPLGVVIAVLLMAACSTPAVSSGGNTGAAGHGGPPSGSETQLSGSRTGLRAASLELVVGARAIDVETSDLGSNLYRVIASGGTPPRVSLSGSQLLVATPGGASKGIDRLTIELNQDVTWRLHLNGGATTETVSLSRGRITSLTMAAGASDMHVALGRPSGAVPVEVTGGANRMTLQVPASTSAAIHLAGSVNSVTIDGVSRGRGSPGASYQLGASGVRGSYQLALRAGINTLTVS